MYKRQVVVLALHPVLPSVEPLVTSSKRLSPMTEATHPVVIQRVAVPKRAMAAIPVVTAVIAVILAIMPTPDKPLGSAVLLFSQLTAGPFLSSPGRFYLAKSNHSYSQ